MNDIFEKDRQLTLALFDKKIASCQFKTDQKIALIIDSNISKLTIEDLRRECNRKYIEDTFPDLKKDIIVRIEDL